MMKRSFGNEEENAAWREQSVVLNRVKRWRREVGPSLLYLAAGQKDMLCGGTETQTREGWRVNGLCDSIGKKCPEQANP